MQDEILKQSHRVKQAQGGERLKEGDLVLIRTADWRPDAWPMGKIIRVLPGADGETRVAIVRQIRDACKGTETKETHSKCA